MNFRPRRSEEPELNLVPLVDTVLVLLVFFMLTTTFQREAQFNVQLPEASIKPMERAAQAVEIAITPQGNYLVNGKALVNTQVDTLKRAILKVADGRKDLPLVISADAKTPHQAVVTAMDAAGQAGFVHLSIATQESTDPGRDADPSAQ